MLLVAGASGLCSIGAAFLSATSATGFGRNVRSNVFGQVSGFSLHEFDKLGTATLITRTTNDINQVTQVLLIIMRMMVTAPLMMIGGVLMAVAKDAYPRDGQSQSYVIGFAEVEVDTETGAVKVIDYVAIGDVGRILNPRGLKGQLFGGSMLGLGHALTQLWAYDQHYGLALARRFHHNRPPTILDAPSTFIGDAVNLPDPETPTGIRGVGEPPVGAAYGAIMNAIADAIGDEIFRKSPVSADIILNALENGGKRTHEALTAHV